MTPPHPRDTYALEGAEAAEAAFLDALGRGRLHHAWLLTGPEGLGKATFAYRAARRLLGAAPAPAFGALGATPDDPVSRQVAARSHPDLMVLERAEADGKLKRVIGVDEARRLPEVFTHAPGSAAYRVAIIDAADDLNVNAANAVLKTLEEPPPRGVLFLVSHAPGRLLPTIRSRCRVLRFRSWGEAKAAAFVEQQTGLSRAEAEALAALADGAPGRAWRMAASGGLDADKAALELLRALPQVDPAAVYGLAEGFRGAEGAGRFRLLAERLAERTRAMVVDQAQRGAAAGAELDAWSRAWSRLVSLPAEAEALNLDRADVLWTLLGELGAAALTAGPSTGRAA